jgi:hypothetical protein
MIRNTRIRFGEAPRQFDAKEMAYLKPATPAWCRAGKDELHVIYRDAELLLTRGHIVWGSLIQANNLLFSPGPDDCPGAAVYCSEVHRHDDLTRLAEISQRASNIKGAGATPDETKFGKILAGEIDRFFAYQLPKTITNGDPVLATCIMGIRKHLPAGVLSHSYFPLLTHPETKATLILPARYWDPVLFDLWMAPA